MMYTKESEEILKAWMIETISDFMEHPEIWPVKKEFPISGCSYWAYLEVRKSVFRGRLIWAFEVGAYRGVDANIEMSMELVSGTEEDLLQCMQKDLQKNGSRPLSFVDHMCDRIEEKDDDYHSDFW